jgi:CBS domain-containing protein
MFVHQISAARRPPAIVKPDARLNEVARLLSSEHVNLVAVCGADGRMIGVIDDRDIVRGVASCNDQLCACCARVARDVMTAEVVACSPEDELRDVWARIKERQLRHLPVIDQNGRPITLLNARDVLLHLFEEVEFAEHEMRDYFLSVGYH